MIQSRAFMRLFTLNAIKSITARLSPAYAFAILSEIANFSFDNRKFRLLTERKFCV